MFTQEEVNVRFTYHPPVGSQGVRYAMLRRLAREFAHEMNSLCPVSDELGEAMRLLQQANMMANAAIACHPPEGVTVPEGEGLAPAGGVGVEGPGPVATAPSLDLGQAAGPAQSGGNGQAATTAPADPRAGEEAASA